jgi:hypothetical protein
MVTASVRFGPTGGIRAPNREPNRANRGRTGCPPGRPFRWMETRNIDRNFLVILAIVADAIYRLGHRLGNPGRRPAKDPKGRPKAFKGDDLPGQQGLLWRIGSRHGIAPFRDRPAMPRAREPYERLAYLPARIIATGNQQPIPDHPFALPCAAIKCLTAGVPSAWKRSTVSSSTRSALVTR